MSPIVYGIAGYVLLQLAVGFAASRRVRTEEDFLLAGRRLGYPLAIFSIFATWFGAETCVGSAGAVYAGGLSASTAEPFGYALCLLAMGFLFARALWKRKLTTLADLFRARYSPAVERVAVLLMVPSSLLWAAAQIRAFGQVLSASSGLGVTLAVSIAALVAVVYTSFGGLYADAATDFLQGIVLVVGLVVLIVVVTSDLGGAGAALQKIERARLDIFPAERSLLATAEAWAIPVVGSLFAQELVSRVIACRSPEVARRSTLVAATLYFGLGIIPIFLGLLGTTLVPDISDPEHVLPNIAAKYLSTVPYVIFVGAVVSAILSTVDTTLLVCASLVSHNVLVPLAKSPSEAAKVRWARAAVVVLGAVAYAVALAGSSVSALVEEASALGGAGFAVVVVFSLFTRWGGTPSAIAALLGSAAAYLLAEHVWHVETPFLVSLAVALVGYLALAKLGAERPE